MTSDPNHTKILLVCDNKADVANIRLRLEESIKVPCYVWHCHTLAMALDYLNKKKLRADIIILDLGLIGTTSPKEIYKKMGEAALSIPIIVLTGTGEEEHDLATLVMESGAADHMVRGQFSRIIDAIEFSLIRHKITIATANKTLSDHQTRQDARNIESLEIKKQSDEKHLQKNQFISWVTGGYSVEENNGELPNQSKAAKTWAQLLFEEEQDR
jgi:DNA-binding response OmpR family regulator